jgi:multisubunit Na+/H+ antiporter MnhB subunit
MALKDILLKDGKLTKGAKIGAGVLATGVALGLLTRKKKKQDPIKTELEEEPKPNTPPEKRSDEKKSNTGLYIGIGVAVVVVSGIIFYLVKSSKK